MPDTLYILSTYTSCPALSVCFRVAKIAGRYRHQAQDPAGFISILSDATLPHDQEGTEVL